MKQAAVPVTLYLFGLVFLMLHICFDRRVIAKFDVVNNTVSKVDSLSIMPNVSTGKDITLDPDQARLYKADMTGLAMVDGSYQVRYKLKDSTFQRVFGYYTNGHPLSTRHKIVILADTALISEHRK